VNRFRHFKCGTDKQYSEIKDILKPLFETKEIK